MFMRVSFYESLTIYFGSMRVYYLFWISMYGYAVVFTAPQQFHAPSVSRVAV